MTNYAFNKLQSRKSRAWICQTAWMSHFSTPLKQFLTPHTTPSSSHTIFV